MKTTHGRLLAGLIAICAAGAVSAQNQTTTTSQPAVAFPPTPTPAPKAEPMTPEKLDEHVVPRDFLGRTSDVLALVYGGFRRSQVDPCGCVSHQLGGLDKEAALVKRINELQIPVLQVDAGGFIRDMPDQKMLTQAKYLLTGLGKMGYDVINVGFTDLALTPAELKQNAQEAGVKLVSANLVGPDGNPIFDPYVIQEVKLTNGQALKIGVIGVTRPRVEVQGDAANLPSTIAAGSPQAGTSETLTVLNPIETINKYAPEVAGKADFVVVMDYDRRGNADKVVKGLTDKSLVDVLVMGENSQIQGTVQNVDGVQVVSGGYEGRQLGTLYMELKDNNVASTWNKHIEVLQTIPPVPEITQLIEEVHSATQPPSNATAATPATTPAGPAKLDLGTQ